jgi:hypothetical protein
MLQSTPADQFCVRHAGRPAVTKHNRQRQQQQKRKLTELHTLNVALVLVEHGCCAELLASNLRTAS